MHNHDANATFREPIKDEVSATLQKAFLKLFHKIKLKGHKPNIIRLDNDTLREHLSLLENLDLKVKLVPLCEHQQNLSKRAIQIYKNHLVVGISGAEPIFSLILWDTLIPQVNITIHLLQNSRVYLRLSVHTQIFGQFDYNAIPLVLPGCKQVTYDKPKARKLWVVYGTKAFCTGLAM